jgi:hypothetical protein
MNLIFQGWQQVLKTGWQNLKGRDMIVELTNVEQRLARFLAKARHDNARSQGVKNSKMGDQSDEETDLEGVAAEIAFCRLFNVYPDLQLDIRPVEDCVLSNGRSVDVKSTTYTNGRLLVVRWKKPDVDLFALMVGQFPKYRYVGSMSAEELLREHRLKDLGHGEGYMADQKELQE